MKAPQDSVPPRPSTPVIKDHDPIVMSPIVKKEFNDEHEPRPIDIENIKEAPHKQLVEDLKTNTIFDEYNRALRLMERRIDNNKIEQRKENTKL